MTAFRFRLERVLQLRRVQLELEEAKLRQAAAALAAIDREQSALETRAASAEVEVRRWSEVAGRDLAALEDFRAHARSQQQLLAARRAQAVRDLAAQETAMLEARRRCRLLERLKERRWSEWRAASDRELEEIAAESWLAQWGRAEPGRL